MSSCFIVCLMKSKMEYNLLKTFETNFGYSGSENDIFSDDLILPGIGQILNFNSVIMPLHNAQDFTKIAKKNDLQIEQTGGGNESIDISEEKNIEPESEKAPHIEEDTNLDTEKKNELEDSELILNERKRKQLDPSIYESFMHPKMFKTNKITIQNTSVKKASKDTKKKDLSVNVMKNDTVKKVKHKFNLY